MPPWATFPSCPASAPPPVAEVIAGRVVAGREYVLLRDGRSRPELATLIARIGHAAEQLRAATGEE